MGAWARGCRKNGRGRCRCRSGPGGCCRYAASGAELADCRGCCREELSGWGLGWPARAALKFVFINLLHEPGVVPVVNFYGVACPFRCLRVRGPNQASGRCFVHAGWRTSVSASCCGVADCSRRDGGGVGGPSPAATPTWDSSRSADRGAAPKWPWWSVGWCHRDFVGPARARKIAGRGRRGRSFVRARAIVAVGRLVRSSQGRCLCAGLLTSGRAQT